MADNKSPTLTVYVARRRDIPGNGYVAKCGEIKENGLDAFDATMRVLKRLSKIHADPVVNIVNFDEDED